MKKFEFFKKVNGNVTNKPFYVIDGIYGCNTKEDAIKLFTKRLNDGNFSDFKKNHEYIIKES